MLWLVDIDDPDYDYENVCDNPSERVPKKITCKHCKKPGFTFVKLGNGSWMLRDKNGILHTCVRDARREKIRAHGEERRKAFHEISVVMNGENPSIDDINHMLEDAARQDRQDKFFNGIRSR